MMSTYMETSGSGEFHFDDIPPGLYSVGVVALPATRESSESDVAASLAAGRFAVQPVEIAAGEVTTLDVTVPR